jgi:protease II
MQRPDLPLTVHEYDEFGHPDDTHALSYIRSYSPCSNIGSSREGDGDSRLGNRGGGGGGEGGGGEPGEGERCNYPAMFLSTGLLDTKVSPLESIRWVLAVRACIEKNRKEQKKEQKREQHTSSHHSNQSSHTPSESVRPVLLHITSNCGHDGPSDASEHQRLKAIEIVFMENAILERQKSLD